MWLFLGFCSLGFLIGHLVGFSASEISSSVAGLLFAFGGGSAIAFVQKLDAGQQKNVHKAIGSLAVSCLIGVYASIAISEYRLLSPPSEDVSGRDAAAGTSIKDNKYLFSNLVGKAHGIDATYQSGRLSLEDAYDQMYETIGSLGDSDKQ